MLFQHYDYRRCKIGANFSRSKISGYCFKLDKNGKEDGRWHNLIRQENLEKLLRWQDI